MARIGLEIHVQLNTESKLFCGCRNESGGEPNTNVCPTCLGMPGSKPRINGKAIRMGYLVSMILNAEPETRMFFSRKSYFYPDMSKNFQITQYEIPLARNGYFEISGKKIRITRVHLEEDPARLVHVGGGITSADYVLADYNRSGVPLCEIVTEPDFKSADEVVGFMRKLLTYLQRIKVFDVKKCNWRADVNVSIPEGNRSEIKNVGSIKDIEKSIRFEIMRQEHLVKFGKEVKRETRAYDSETGKTRVTRTKEEEIDYGYVFEPDLTSFSTSREHLDELKESLPELPDEMFKRLKEEYGLNSEQASILVYSDPYLAFFFEECAKEYDDYEKLANWLVVETLGALSKIGKEFYEFDPSVKSFVQFLELMDEGRMTARLGQELVHDYVKTGEEPKKLLDEKGLGVIKDEAEIKKVVKDVLSENEKAVRDYEGGEEKAIHYLVGKVMEKTQAQVDPKTAKEKILELLG